MLQKIPIQPKLTKPSFRLDKLARNIQQVLILPFLYLAFVGQKQNIDTANW